MLTNEQKQKLAAEVRGVDYERGFLYIEGDDENDIKDLKWLPENDCWPLVGAIVEECERRGLYWRLLPSYVEVSDRILTLRKPRTRTESFCLAFLAAVEASK